MASVVFPNIDSEHFKWKSPGKESGCAKNNIIDKKLEMYLAKPETMRSAQIRVEFPPILSSDCSTWLSTRKALSDKKQSTKKKAEEDKWLMKSEVSPSPTLNMESVRKGLLAAGELDKSSTTAKDDLATFVSKKEKTEEEEAPKTSLAGQVKMGLLKARGDSVEKSEGSKYMPWTPKSLNEVACFGLTATKEKFQSSSTDEKQEATETLCPVESLAQSLKKSLLNISIDDKSFNSMETDYATQYGEIKKETSPLDDDITVSATENIENWILEDNRSEVSIITLNTNTDSIDMEEYDDLEEDLSMWISN